MQALDGDSRYAAVYSGFSPLCRGLNRGLSCNLIDCVHTSFASCLIRGLVSHVHGKNMRMSFTSTTSARITNSEDKTTELVAARPTPAAPPCVRIPWKHAI